MTTLSAVLKQGWLAMTASIGYLTVGLVRGFSSTAIPSMEEHNPYLVPDVQVISWISAVPPLGALLGSLISGPMMHKLGRKRTLMISSPLFTFAWISLAYATKWWHLVLARAFSGVCGGIVLPSAQIYVTECSHPGVRGIAGTFPALFMSAGILTSYILGSLMTWNDMSVASAAFPTLLLFLLIPLPESPAWLSICGKTNDANNSLEWLQRQPNKNNEPSEIKKKKILTFRKEDILRRPVLEPFGIVVAILIFQQICGIDSIIFYTVQIFKASGSTIDGNTATTIIGAVQLVATFISLFLVECFGRRVLLISSGLLMSVSMIAMGTYSLYILKMPEYLGVLPLVFLIVFITGFSIGFSNIPFILMTELLPTAQRGILSSISVACNLGFMFVVIKTFPFLAYALGSASPYWIYAFFSFSSTIFVHYLLPETKGKTLEEIEQYFEDKDNDKNDLKLNDTNVPK